MSVTVFTQQLRSLFDGQNLKSYKVAAVDELQYNGSDLIVRSVEITSENAELLALLIEQSPSLQGLSLENCTFLDNFTRVCDAISTNETLVEINIELYELTTEDINYLLNSLSAVASLNRLNLYTNVIALRESLDQLIMFLETNATLTEFEFETTILDLRHVDVSQRNELLAVLLGRFSTTLFRSPETTS